MRILLVEDAIGEPIRKVLNKWGHEVTLATTGAEAHAALRTPDFELFLLDWMLPDASGLDLVRTIRDNAKYSEAAILMISSRTDRDDIVTAIRSGIDAYVAKPFKAEELRGRIDEVWQRRSRNRGQAQQIELILGQQERLRESRVNPPVESRSNPLVILGEGSVTAGALARGTSTRILEYLATATTAIAAANAFMPRLRLGYYLAATTGEVTQLIKDRQTRESAVGDDLYRLLRQLRAHGPAAAHAQRAPAASASCSTNQPTSALANGVKSHFQLKRTDSRESVSPPLRAA